MDIYTLIVVGHVIGTVLGAGGATIAEFQITTALRDKKVSADERGRYPKNGTPFLKSVNNTRVAW